MKYALRGITAEELTYTINRVKMERNAKFEIKPQFSRTIRRVQENDKLYFVSLEVKVESTEAEPKPFNLKARLGRYLRSRGGQHRRGQTRFSPSAPPKSSIPI